MLLLSSADLFQINILKKNLPGTLSVSNGSDPFLSVLTWVQTVCKGYQETIKHRKFELGFFEILVNS